MAAFVIVRASETHSATSSPIPLFRLPLLVKRCAGNDALEANVKHSQASKMNVYTKIVNGNPLNSINLRNYSVIEKINDEEILESCMDIFCPW